MSLKNAVSDSRLFSCIGCEGWTAHARLIWLCGGADVPGDFFCKYIESW
jgi:hypothetical protein